MLIEACLNGARHPGAHPRLPITPTDLARDAEACANFGAGAIHVHPRDEAGHESLAVPHVGATVAAIRSRCDLPIGVTTVARVLPDPRQRYAVVRSWAELTDDARPDFASVNVGEPGWEQIVAALLDIGIRVELGISEPEDPAELAASGLAARCERFLVAPQVLDPDAAIRSADALLAALEALTTREPPLAHGWDTAAWPVLEWALDRGLDSRIGLEDTLELPDGNLTPDNAALLAAAFAFLMEPH